jgi:hypothetical protein
MASHKDRHQRLEVALLAPSGAPLGKELKPSSGLIGRVTLGDLGAEAQPKGVCTLWDT